MPFPVSTTRLNFGIGGGGAAGERGFCEDAVEVGRDFLQSQIVVAVAMGAANFEEMLTFRLLWRERGFGMAAGWNEGEGEHYSRAEDSSQGLGGRRTGFGQVESGILRGAVVEGLARVSVSQCFYYPLQERYAGFMLLPSLAQMRDAQLWCTAGWRRRHSTFGRCLNVAWEPRGALKEKHGFRGNARRLCRLVGMWIIDFCGGTCRTISRSRGRMTKEIGKLTPLPHTADNQCFGCGDANVAGLHLEFLLAEDGTVVSLPMVPDRFEGLEGYLHGGIIATILDEAMSKAVRAIGRTAMTRQMEVEYLRPVPSGMAIRIEGRVTRSEGRKHWTEGEDYG